MDKHKKCNITVYESEQEAAAAIVVLIDRGYNKKDISVFGRTHKHVNLIADETDTEVEENAVTGAITGGALGGVTGLLVGLGALIIPGIGPIVAAGPIAASLIGALTGAGLGGLTGALVGLEISDDEAEYYGNSVEDGKILVLVQNRDLLPCTLDDQEQVIPLDVDKPINGLENDQSRFDAIKKRNPSITNQ